MKVRGSEDLRAADVVYQRIPGFATDMQPNMALMTQAAGIPLFQRTFLKNRFMHASELMRWPPTSAFDGAARS